MTGETAWATWDEAIAQGRVTNHADGLPDARIVPLVEHLRARGVTTLQSCSGHMGTDDGCLWIVADEAAEWVSDLPWEPFTFIKRTLHPVHRWEVGWLPENLGSAEIALLGTLTTRGEA